MKITLAVAAAAIALTAAYWMGWPVDPFLADARQLAHGELWRLITGPLVHSDLGQAARDLSMLVLVGLVWERSFGARYLWLMLLCLVVPTSIALAVHFELGTYFGLSGAVNGLFTAALIRDVKRSRLVAGLLVVHCAKLVYESVSGAMLLPMELASGVTPLPIAHLAGACTGLLFVLAEKVGSSTDEMLRISDLR